MPPLHSQFQIPLPATEILSYLFGTPSESSASTSNPAPSANNEFDSPAPPEIDSRPLYIDAEDPAHFLSSKDVLLWVKRLGLGLQEKGLRRGEVVMVYSHNHIFVPVAYLGAMAAGGVFSGCNPSYGVDETAYQISNTQCTIILVEPPLLPTLLAAAQKASFPTSRIFLFSDHPTPSTSGIHDFRSILPSTSAAESWTWDTLTESTSASSLAALNYSSGTTGLPKGVMITHSNIIANVEQCLYMRDLEQPYTRDARPEERWLGFLPLYHAYGQLWSICAALRTRTPVYFMRKFEFTKFLGNIETFKITHIQTAPPVLVMLAKRPETRGFDLRSLKNVLCGAAPLSKELQNAVTDKFDVKVCQTWGMTEVTCCGLHVPGGRDDRSGSVGLLDPNCSVKLLAEDGNEVGMGERGEIWIKGPNVCKGYWRNEGATKQVFDDEGYLRTGDVAVWEKDEGTGLERFWIVDRMKELIKVKGFQVAPAELEARLLEHEVVGDVAVVGLQIDHEEHPRAYVVLKPDHADYSSTSEWDIEQWMASRVAKHKQLTGGVVFIDEVPKSPSGKIQRKVLREWAKRDVGMWKGRGGRGAKL